MIKSIGVIGAGQMGSGIAHVCALAGLDVKLSDLSSDRLTKAVDSSDKNIGRQVARGKTTEKDKVDAIKRIQTGTDYTMFNGCDMDALDRVDLILLGGLAARDLAADV